MGFSRKGEKMVGLARSPRRRLRAGGRVTPLRFGCPPWATLLTRCSASLRLPTLGYTFDFPFYHGAIARVFAPAQLIRRISPTCSSFGAALRQSISTFPEGLDSPFGPTCGWSLTCIAPDAAPCGPTFG